MKAIVLEEPGHAVVKEVAEAAGWRGRGPAAGAEGWICAEAI